MSKYDFLVKARGHLRTQITKLTDKVQATVSDSSRTEKLSWLTRLESFDSEIKKYDREVNEEGWSESKDADKLSLDLDTCDSYSQKIAVAISLLKDSLSNDDQALHSPAALFAHTPTRLNKLKLPEIPLPTFSHARDENLTHFLRNFDSSIDKYELSSYEKFIYLKKQLKGDPLVLVNSLSGTDQSYENARALLEEAFARTVTQQFDAIKRLSRLRLTPGSSPFEFVSEMRSVQDLFRDLDVGIDTVLQYFVWNGMPNALQNQLITICNNNNPSMQQINDNIFKAIDRFKEIKERYRYDSIQKAGTPQAQVANFATNVNYVKDHSVARKVSFCSLCSVAGGSRESSHSTKDCPKFKTPESKRDRLLSLNACVRCGYSNHSDANCHFKFNKPCFHCNGKHMTFLCVQGKPKSSGSNSSEGKKEPKVSSGVVWAETALDGNVGNQVLLPTFTCEIMGQTIRAFKDSGCQPNFILDSLADELKLNILDNDFPVTVNGFNESKRYVTKIVSVPLTLNGKVVSVHAICVPEIRTSLSLPGLRQIAKVFKSKGYRLADKFLHESDCVSNIKFILGNQNVEILPEKQIPFGLARPSVYSETSLGVLLFGDVTVLRDNLIHLTDISV